MIEVPCPVCGKFPPPACGCVLPAAPPEPAAEAPKPRKGFRPDILKLRREKRHGRDVIVIEGLPADVVIDDVARELKAACGTGGTVKGRSIEIQGDHREKIAEALLARGFRSKRAGG